ncbi:MAG: hypothetical protein OXG35_14440 [Acidobacteria bacterium]|nr:hypothetical protein [Acidobacteriota bacterium]
MRADKWRSDHRFDRRPGGARLIVTDTAPHSGGDAVTVAKLSDHILVPVQPSYPEIAAITRTLEIAEMTRTPATIILNLALVNHGSIKDALAVIKTTGVPAAPVTIHRRRAHVTSFNAGMCATEHESDGKAAGELQALFAWLQASEIVPRTRKGKAA